MKLDDYQDLAAVTARADVTAAHRRTIAALGLTGEAGEVADLVKKEVGHGHPEDTVKIAAELGDVMWYVAETASAYGLRLSDIAESNIDKLVRRYPEGFSTAASLARVDAVAG